MCSKVQPIEINNRDFEAWEAPIIETEPTISESNEEFEVLQVRRRATNVTEYFEPVEATTQTTNGNYELLDFNSLLSLPHDLSPSLHVCFSLWFPLICFSLLVS